MARTRALQMASAASGFREEIFQCFHQAAGWMAASLLSTSASELTQEMHRRGRFKEVAPLELYLDAQVLDMQI